MTSHTRPPTILITRPQEDAQDLAAQIEELGYTALIEPLLDIKAVAFHLPPLDDIAGLIVTSKNALRAMPEDLIKEITPLTVYCVGNATSTLAKDMGFTNIIDAGGDRQDLIRILDGVKIAAGTKLLYLSGTDISGEIEIPHLAVERLPVYTADKTATLSGKLQTGLKSGHIEAVLFFSPRTAENFCALINTYNLQDSLRTAKAVCLSENIRKAVDKFTWKAILTARRPDQLSLLAEIK